MERFYFHIRANGTVVPDRDGRQFNGAREAFDYATTRTPPLLRKYKGTHNTYVSIQICDKEEHTIAVIRGTVILEKWKPGLR